MPVDCFLDPTVSWDLSLDVRDLVIFAPEHCERCHALSTSCHGLFLEESPVFSRQTLALHAAFSFGTVFLCGDPEKLGVSRRGGLAFRQCRAGECSRGAGDGRGYASKRASRTHNDREAARDIGRIPAAEIHRLGTKRFPKCSAKRSLE